MDIKILLGSASLLRYSDEKDFNFDIMNDTYLEINNFKKDCIKLSFFLQQIYLLDKNENINFSIYIDFMENKDSRKDVASFAKVITDLISNMGHSITCNEDSFISSYKDNSICERIGNELITHAKNFIYKGTDIS